MRPFLALLLMLLSGRAAAHAVAVDMNAFLEGKQFVVLMNGPGGEPINGAKLEGLLFNDAGTTYRVNLPQVADGEYRANAFPAASGEYTLLLRDSTFPGESLDTQARVRYPLTAPIRLLLPPSKAGAPSVPVLVILTLAPIGLSLLVLVFILLGRKKTPAPEEQQSAALEEGAS